MSEGNQYDNSRPLMTMNAGPGLIGESKSWEEIATFLWALLDDIDTASDIFKPEKTGFYNYVINKSMARWEVGTSDGYSLVFNVDEGEQ